MKTFSDWFNSLENKLKLLEHNFLDDSITHREYKKRKLELINEFNHLRDNLFC